MKISEVRKIFLDYFKEKGHAVVPSSNLLPKKDPTLLFTNAGMNQFKDVFLGLDSRDYKRASSCQKCVRAGGKHNDLENVGFTYRHHTFFEMLGNFSFGDYFKKEAIEYAWELLTKKYNIPTEKLFVTVYKDDDEAYELWNKNIGVPTNKIFRLGDKDNFWSMGEVGPCGPCSEIYYDHGPNHGCGKPDCKVGCDCDRYVEIWNLVFMQYNRDEKGKLTKLPKPSIDTGAGLERLTAVMQGVASNYDIDIFKNIKKNIQKGKEHEGSCNAIADHLRSIAFLISDGCFPSNEGAGYVLRRIIRRAIRHGKVLGFDSPFLYKNIPVVCDLMGDAYPELVSSKNEIQKILLSEEEKFFETLDKGLSLLEKELASLSKGKKLNGQIAFKLYDTYGFPLDLTQMICKEKDIDVDIAGFEKEMENQRTMARTARTKNQSTDSKISDADIEIVKSVVSSIKSDFIGYEEFSSKAKCLLIIKDGKLVECLDKGDKGVLIFDKTPFYAESGGQIADTGTLELDGKKIAEVVSVQKPVSGIHLHLVSDVSSDIKKGKEYHLLVSKELRSLIQNNHTATHMLHHLLRTKLGEHVKQAGSLVNSKFFTFDFNHYEKMSNDVLSEIEEELNLWILKGDEVSFSYMSYNDAVRNGAIALFDEKYGDKVRVVRIGDKSFELCGGTHVNNTSDIGVFKIIAEESTGAGVRRIRATTSFNAYEIFETAHKTVKQVSNELKCSEFELIDKVGQILEENKKLKKENEEFKSVLAKGILEKSINSAEQINDIKFLFTELNGASAKDLREYSEYVKSKGIDLAILCTSNDGGSSIVITASKKVASKVPASELMKYLSSLVGGKGGGNPEYVQGGGVDINKLVNVLPQIKEFISNR